jgi:hypothetical protein
MSELTKYGQARDFYLPIPKAGSTDFALAADWTPVAGDVKVSKDGAADANITTLPAAPASTTGLWKVALSATELTAKQISVRIMDPATAAVVHDALTIVTFGDVNAQFPYDFSLPNYALGAIFYGSVTGAVTTTTLIDSKLTAGDTDFYKGRILLPLTGTQRYQGSKITAFNPATDQLTFDQMTQAMANGNLYAIC